ncbi:MAG TPA: hypothetical protein P5084_05025 [Paludibacter sp.]|nr:hypothetical protein [Paludibacter sp.]
MKRVLFILLAVLSCVSVINAQSYNKVKVSLRNGLIEKGSKAVISDESVTFKSGNEMKTYQLSEVSLIEAKKGSAGKWAMGCGGGCLAVNLIYGISNGMKGVDIYGAETSTASYLMGTIVETVVGAGIGYLIGSLTDHNEIVYNKNMSLLNNFKFNVTTDQLSKQGPKISNLTLSYRF